MNGGELFFDLKTVVEVAETTMRAASHSSSWGDREEGKESGPCLVWAKDAGTYLMSNATPLPLPWNIVYASANEPDGLVLDDRRADGVWEESRTTAESICGGDDFAEYITLPDMIKGLREALDEGYTHFVLKVDAESYTVSTFQEE